MIWNLFKIEGMKLKRITWITPILSGLLLLIVTIGEWYLFFREGEGGVYASFNALYLFVSISFLLTGNLLITMVVGTEHESKGWKQFLAAPLSKSHLYMVKLAWVVALILVQGFVFIIGWALIWHVYTTDPLPFLFLLKQVFYCIIATLPVLIIQFYLSIAFENQAIPITIGVLGAIASLFLARSQVNWLHYLPWSYPGLVTPFLPNHIHWLQISLGISTILLLFTNWLFYNKNWN
ncbi:ABC transporter permease [Hazenella sp. IB182353]|nr:ABC transporter permease [Polycladospora coralii]MBS7529145.1 ABC transporter permease [Polycladospora coralii]